jgi:hypothetical protein
MNLSSEERQTLESIARKYTSSYCDVIRAKIVLLADEGLSNDVIASRLLLCHADSEYSETRNIGKYSVNGILSVSCAGPI